MRAIEKHALWLRWTHWVNFPLLALMAWSGVLIYWANDVYPGFFPAWFYKTFRINNRLAEGMSIHFAVGWLFAINGALYLLFTFASGHWRELMPDRRAIRDLAPTMLHELGLRKAAPPQGKFNAAQRFAYTSAAALGALELATGLAIYKPVQLSWLRMLFGGYDAARAIHFAGMVSLVLFFVVHVVQVARAGCGNLRSMIAGFDVVDE